MKAKYPKTLAAFGARVKNLRQEKGMTQIDLAVAANLDRSTIQRIENGGINPSIDLVIGLAIGLEIPLRELMDLEIGDGE